jgi:ParB family transcriptional regulator, chromosome partitioning protein
MNKEPDRSQRKALGKGLSALLPNRHYLVNPDAQPEPSAAPVNSTRQALPDHFEEFQSIPLDAIRPDRQQPRDNFDEAKLEELSQSIRAHGVIQPITVRKVAENSYQIIAGERRWRAASLAGLKEIPALVRSVEEHDSLQLALIENIQREDLNPIEIATAFQRLVSEHHLSHEQIAERTGKDRSTVTNFLRLLKLVPPVRHALATGQISMGHARALLNLDPDTQALLCVDIIGQQLSVRQAESLAKRASQPKKEAQLAERKEDVIDPNVRAAIDEMSMALGTKVKLIQRNEKSGRLEIEYYSQDDLDRIYSVIVK